MKKYAVVLVLWVILMATFFLSSCDPVDFYFDADEIVENASKIQLVVCQNYSPTIVNVESDTVLYFNMTDMVVVKELEKEKIESFAYDLSKITFFEINESVNSPLGFTVLIYLKTNEVIVLSCTLIGNLAHGMVALFTAEGEYIRHIGIFADRPAFERLLNNYFGV